MLDVGERSYEALVDAVFGDPDDPMTLVDERARELLQGRRAVVWQGDATNFQFLYVGENAEEVFGYPRARWTDEPTFWADVVVHPEDRNHAVSYCALCTGKGKDHDFEYRAVTADGRVLKLHDIVKVIKGGRGVAVLLRGLMIDITADEWMPSPLTGTA